ncbi:MAG: hypothetical protein ACOXZV_13540 [Bacteroidales bacterium]|jgi:tetratricopeptide (TPR) repeat protein
MNNFRAGLIATPLQLITLFLFTCAASAQSGIERKKIFAQAETYFLYEEYDLASQLYLQLESPDNHNISYKIGACYVNIPDEKLKAISYLENAVRNIDHNAKSHLYKENRAPLDAYFYLAKAYLVNDEFDKALSTLEKFNDLAKTTKDRGGMRNPDFIDQQIKACKNAIELRKTPIDFTKTPLGPDFSQSPVNENTAESFDGSTIVFTEKSGLSNKIMFSRKEEGKWTKPRQFLPVPDPGGDISSCSLNKDGSMLFLYKTDNYDGNIYSSEYSEGNWTPLKKLNGNINTKFYESHASVSSDGKRLFFASNRDGGYGGLDIYMSEMNASGEWGPAINLGSTVNTRFNEDTPFITANDSLLYFSSEGHSSMGGYDIFVSRSDSSGWSSPENIGFPLNTTGDDLFFQPVNNGKNGYYSMSTDYKKKDIFYISFGSSLTAEKRIFDIRGIYQLDDILVPFDDNYSIHLINRTSGDTIDVGYPNKHTGQYNITAGPGQYRLVYSGTGRLTQIIDTTITASSISDRIVIDVTLSKDPNYVFTQTVTAPQPPAKYERINLDNIPVVPSIDSSILFWNLRVNDITDTDIPDSEVIYYTVQLMALYNPVDIRYFKFVDDVRVMFDPNDKFYRYITGIFATKEAAFAYRDELVNRGYENDLFIKKISKY